MSLGKGAWCPFNSQNTAFWRDAFPLLYLPAYCSFRMTDIWRSFVAQRIAWENGWSILFHEPTVYQFRNDHSLMRDFADEVPGYLHNRKIGDTLAALSLRPGVEQLGANLLACYEELVRVGVMEAEGNSSGSGLARRPEISRSYTETDLAGVAELADARDSKSRILHWV